MAQIVGINSDIFRCNLSAIQTGGSKAGVILAADEVWLVNTTNSLTNSGSGDCDCYIVGNGQDAATELELKSITNGIVEEGVLDGVSGDAVYRMMRVYPEKPNLFNKNTATDNYYINGTTLTSNNGYFVSDYIPVSAETAYSFSQYINFRSYFNANKTYISKATDTVTQITTPANAAYIRFSGPKGSGASLDGMMMIEGAIAPTEYLPYGFTYEKYALAKDLDAVEDELKYGDNLVASYGASGMTTGKILKVGGSTANNAGYMTSDIIELPDNVSKIVTNGLSKNNSGTYIGFLLYDAGQSVLPLVCASGEEIPSEIDVATNYAGAKYMRYCCATSSTPSVEVYVAGTIKDEIIQLEAIKPLGELIGVSSINYGNKYTQGRDYANQPLWFTHEGVACLEDGILKSVWFYAPASGTYQFAVGVLDQNNLLVNERYFEITFSSAGVNEVDISERYISIHKGEQIFAKFNSTLNATLYNSEPTSSSLYASSSSDEFIRKWTYGAISGLGWSILEIESPFALKSELMEAEEKITTLETLTKNIGYIVTQTGEKYRMGVNNGEIVLLSTEYTKVLALGNSLTNHGPKADIGWYGGAWAMAATREETGWTYQFQRILRQKQPSAIVNSVNIATWERNPAVSLSFLDAYLTNDVDCIIFRAGENAHPTDIDTWANDIKSLLTYCVTRSPNASIILSTCMWSNAMKDEAITKVASDWGLPLINPGTSSNRERLGDYTEGEDTLLYPIINAGVANHINDVGFLRFANRLASNIGYSELDEVHNVSVIDSNSIGYTCFPTWVTCGIFNIHTTASVVTAVDANNNTLAITNHNDGVFTFIMPDSDVTITIS